MNTPTFNILQTQIINNLQAKIDTLVTEREGLRKEFRSKIIETPSSENTFCVPKCRFDHRDTRIKLTSFNACKCTLAHQMSFSSNEITYCIFQLAKMTGEQIIDVLNVKHINYFHEIHATAVFIDTLHEKCESSPLSNDNIVVLGFQENKSAQLVVFFLEIQNEIPVLKSELISFEFKKSLTVLLKKH